MTLTTQAEIEEYSGFKFSDFTENGLEMTPTKWASFISLLVPKITQMMQRYCNVYSFEASAFVEYHSGRGEQNYDSAVSDYNEEDCVYYLHQLYADTLVVSEDTATKTSAPSWVARTLRTTGIAGDYELYIENDVARVHFYQNIPAKGTNNIRFSYNTGYAAASQELKDIKFQCLRACNNVLLTKKKIQEASTIRNFGVRDYSQMFDAFSESLVLDDKVKNALDQYRRNVIPGQWCYD